MDLLCSGRGRWLEYATDATCRLGNHKFRPIMHNDVRCLHHKRRPSLIQLYVSIKGLDNTDIHSQYHNSPMSRPRLDLAS